MLIISIITKISFEIEYCQKYLNLTLFPNILNHFNSELFLVGSIRSATDGIVMYSVNKKENGNIPINAFYAAAVSVMKREEATILMKIKAQSTRTENDLFENIKNQLCSESTEKNEINGKNASSVNNDKNDSNDCNSNGLGKNDHRSGSEENQNNENSLKLRTLNFLHSTLSQQRKSLIASLNHKTFTSLSKELKTVKNDRKNDSNTKVNVENNYEEGDSTENGFNILENNNSNRNSNSNNSNEKNNRSNKNKKDKKISTDSDKEKDLGSDSRSSKNVLISCKYLLLVRDTDAFLFSSSIIIRYSTDLFS
jgi:hypothetical protein